MPRSSSRRKSSRSKRPSNKAEEEASRAEIARILAEERGLRSRSPSPKKKPRSARSRSRGRKSVTKKSPKSKSPKVKKVAKKTPPKAKKKATKSSEKKSTKTVGAAGSGAASADHGFEFEFGGPAGAVSTTIALPLVCYGLFHFCGEDTCPDFSRLQSFLSNPASSVTAMASEFSRGISSSVCGVWRDSLFLCP